MIADANFILEPAGVDKSTVSRVLAGKAATGRICPATQARIRTVSRQLDYHPNPNTRFAKMPARPSSSPLSRQIGLVLSTSSPATSLALIPDLELVIAAADFQLVVMTLPPDPAVARTRLVRLLHDSAGMICCPSIYPTVSAIGPAIVLWRGAAQAILAGITGQGSAPASEPMASPAPAPTPVPTHSAPTPPTPSPVLHATPAVVSVPRPAETVASSEPEGRPEIMERPVLPVPPASPLPVPPLSQPITDSTTPASPPMQEAEPIESAVIAVPEPESTPTPEPETPQPAIVPEPFVAPEPVFVDAPEPEPEATPYQSDNPSSESVKPELVSDPDPIEVVTAPPIEEPVLMEPPVITPTPVIVQEPVPSPPPAEPEPIVEAPPVPIVVAPVLTPAPDLSDSEEMPVAEPTQPLDHNSGDPIAL